MKKAINIFAVAIATLFAFSSCQKEVLENTSVNGARIITAEFENSAIKTTLNDDGKAPEWAEGDVLRLLNSSSCQDVEIISGSGTPESGKAYINGSRLTIGTTLTGALYAVYPASATTLTSCSNGNVSISIPAIQDGTFASANICVAKSSTDDETNKDNLVFCNATSVLEIKTATGVVGVDITAANKIAGTVSVSFTGNDISLTPNLTETTVSVVRKSAPSDKVFYLAAAPGATGSTTATCYKIDKKGSADKVDKTLLKNVIYSMDLSSMAIETPCDLTSTTGMLNGHKYVIIKAKYDGTNDSYLKWATENLGATASNPNGDYFMWGYTDGHSVNTIGTTTGDYGSITNAFSGQTFKDGERGDDSQGFAWDNYIKFTSSTYSDSKKTVFTKYIPSVKASQYGDGGTFFDDKTTLDLADDAANANWGTSWRMPTGGDTGEFTALLNATYWKWEDNGYYVYAPQPGDAGKKNDDSSNTYDKQYALLFFPAAGIGGGTELSYVNSWGRYWSSTLRVETYIFRPSMLDIDSYNINPNNSNERYFGYSVRPVSD